jgi:uncharacterized protein with PQ loop repeat
MFGAVFNNVLSGLVILGIILTFLPQQLRIIRRKSSLGISPYFMLLGITSVLAQLANILLLQIPTLERCIGGKHEHRLNSTSSCAEDMLGIIQVLILTICLAVNWTLFLVYYPRPWSNSTEGFQTQRCLKLFIYYCLACGVYLTYTFIAFGAHSEGTRKSGQIFGLLCTFLSCQQYIPQIYRTIVTKNIGSLSALTLAIQAPGSFFFGYTIAQRPGTDITSWGSFVISGLCQTILVAICAYLRYTDLDVQDVDVFENDTPYGLGENAPLLQS